jgi:hypothetical protein
MIRSAMNSVRMYLSLLYSPFGYVNSIVPALGRPSANIGFAAIGAYQNIFSTPERYSALVVGRH